MKITPNYNQNRPQNKQATTFKAFWADNQAISCLGEEVIEGIRYALIPKSPDSLFSNIHKIGKDANIRVSPAAKSQDLYLSVSKSNLFYDDKFLITQTCKKSPENFANAFEEHIFNLYRKIDGSFEPGETNDNIFKYAKDAIFKGIKLLYTPQKGEFLSEIEELEAKKNSIISIKPIKDKNGNKDLDYLSIEIHPQEGQRYIIDKENGFQPFVIKDKVWIKNWDDEIEFSKVLKSHILDTLDRADTFDRTGKLNPLE